MCEKHTETMPTTPNSGENDKEQRHVLEKAVENEKENIQQFNKDYYCDLHSYDINKHQIIIVLLTIFVFVLMIFGIPWIVIGPVDWVFENIMPLWVDSAVFNTEALPDFLGGMIGILAGFIMERSLFSRLVALSKYKTYLKILNNELKGIYEALEGEGKPCYIELGVLDDLILIADNNAVFYSLPRINLNNHKGEIFNLLLDIYGGIRRYNFDLEEFEKDNTNKQLEENVKEDKDEIKERIKLFYYLFLHKEQYGEKR